MRCYLICESWVKNYQISPFVKVFIVRMYFPSQFFRTFAKDSIRQERRREVESVCEVGRRHYHTEHSGRAPASCRCCFGDREVWQQPVRVTVLSLLGLFSNLPVKIPQLSCNNFSKRYRDNRKSIRQPEFCRVCQRRTQSSLLTSAIRCSNSQIIIL